MRRILIFLCMLVISFNMYAQSRTVSGKVTDEKNQPLTGATITVVGTTVKTISNTSGNFSLTVPSGGKQLRVEYLGYASYVIDLTSATSYDVKLSTSQVNDMGEVVVTGIINQKRSQYSGAANKISEAQIKNTPVGSFDALFQGRAPGVLALTGSGQPGNAANVIIRGTSSIANSSTPLYIVDGVQVEAGVFQGYNPNDFASIEVLRDATAAALYGSRGSAGVIVVTTKKGSGGKMQLEYRGQVGMKQPPTFTYDIMNSSQLLAAQEKYGLYFQSIGSPIPAGNQVNIPGWQYSKLNSNYASLSPAQQQRYDFILDSIRGINTNWRDEFFRNGSFNNHELSLSGGTGRTRIYSALAYYDETGTTYRTDMKRVNWRNNVNYSDDKFSLGVTSNISYVKRNFQQSTTTNNLGNPFLVMNVNVPYALAYNPNGTYATGTGTKYNAANTLELTNLDINQNNQVLVNLATDLRYKLTKDVTLSTTAGVNFRETQANNYGNRTAFVRRTSTTPTGQAGFQSESLTRYFNATVRPMITFAKVINQRHDIEVNAVGEYLKEYNKGISMTGYGIDPRLPNTPAAITQGNAANQLYSTVSGSRSEAGLLSYMAIGRYTLDGKYTINASYRRDGASKLPKDTRWQGYYAVGATWEATKESFLSNIRALNTLRFRVSYGGAGNYNNFPYYAYQATYGSGAYGGLNTLGVSYVGNPGLKWEGVYTLNLGLDFELVNRRIYGDINLYDKRTKDLMIQKTLGFEATGGQAIAVNAGKLQNKGIEWNVNVDVIKNRSFVWTLFANGAYNRNRVLSLGGLPSYEQGTELITEGLPLGSHYEVGWAGVDAATGAPLYYTKDGKVTSTYNSSYAVQNWGTWESPWKGGFGSNLRYKGFDLSVLFSWQRGGTKVNNAEYFLENPVGFLYNGYNQGTTLNFWTKPGDIASTPSPSYGTNFSSKIIRDASFLRLRSLQLQYSLDPAAVQALKVVSGVSFFVRGDNLAIWTKWRGFDPEAGATNINLSEFPNPRTFTGGLTVTFK